MYNNNKNIYVEWQKDKDKKGPKIVITYLFNTRKSPWIANPAFIPQPQ